MEILVTGKHLDVGDALRGHVETNLDATVSKYFNKAMDASVTISREPNGFHAEISAHPGRGLLVQGKFRESKYFYKKVRANAGPRSLQVKRIHDLLALRAVSDKEISLEEGNAGPLAPPREPTSKHTKKEAVDVRRRGCGRGR